MATAIAIRPDFAQRMEQRNHFMNTHDMDAEDASEQVLERVNEFLHDEEVAARPKQSDRDIDDVIADVPAFTIRISGHALGVLVLDCGLEESKIVVSKTTLRDPVAIKKVIYAAIDELCAITMKDIQSAGFKPAVK